MTANLKMPPFIPTSPEIKADIPVKPAPMVVVTIRMDPEKRAAIRTLYRRDTTYNSVSHIIQTAIDEFLTRHAAPAS